MKNNQKEPQDNEFKKMYSLSYLDFEKTQIVENCFISEKEKDEFIERMKSIGIEVNCIDYDKLYIQDAEENDKMM